MVRPYSVYADIVQRRRERAERVIALTVEWLERQPEWTVEQARAAAIYEDQFVNGTSDGPPPKGFLS